jgi:DNA-binding Lrp family transcriptional regulator
MTLSTEDRKALIRNIQADVPLVRRPFAALGEALGASEASVIDALRGLKREQILREISAVLEGDRLGYRSALAAGSIPPERVEAVAATVSEHPTVSHNYLRNHPLNLWFTIAVPRQMPLERTLELLAKEAGVDGFHALCRTHVFKIGVNFDPDSLENRTAVGASAAAAVPSAIAAAASPGATGAPPTAGTAAASEASSARGDVQPLEPSARDAQLFRALQTPLPLVEQPFDELARDAGVDTDALLEFARRHLGGAVRRYVGTLRHRKLGVKENGMVVWRVAEGAIEAAGQRLAQAPEVSHCYARNAIPGFPYTLYSMVHGPTRESCREIARALSRATGVQDYALLFSEREFKKQRLRYFLPELDRWWLARN